MPQRSGTSRIEARIAPATLDIVKRAAEIHGRSVSDFVVAAAQEAARKAMSASAASLCCSIFRWQRY
jgi:uncharacterized protein (DUF1778 family)